MKRKILSLFMIFSVLFMITFSVYAETSNTKESLFKLEAYEDIYKLSEQKDGINLPFIMTFAKSVSYDKLVKHSGITIGQSTVEITDKLEGIHLIMSEDMVTIKGEVENAVIYANNIVVEGKITGDSILMSPSVQILENAKISKDVIIVANNLDIKGKVSGNVIATVTDNANISGTISQDLRIITTALNLENSKINGNVYIETDSDTTKILEQYPEANIVSLKATTEDSKASNIMDIVLSGIITVVIYTFVTFFVCKKENNIVEKAYIKFKENTMYGLMIAVVSLMLLIVLPILLIVLAIMGLGVIAWPVLIIYLGIILLSISTSTLVVGMTIYVAIKDKVKKWKLPAMAVIFVVLFALTQIPYIAYYAIIAINLISLAIIITMITKKIKVVEEAKENK